ncbi:hypothetical protein THAOC_28686 [Thalassiosira oceanica]|uniref:Uncharacterized protein n=1 Tax=Thalassiosira oceanica TaxID=159749 RepID=K0RT53_THAOC|nr:hypothetical protein THAOC_28686 [Thalassiosira oceanica]|eukprot:EJK52081.1 hypothetical protein THAOC_28686 [Thalassiosira oceanica]
MEMVWTRCVACYADFRHEAPDETPQGYCTVACPTCGAALLRCCFCRANWPKRRRLRMLDHIETYHRTEIAAANDVELGVGGDLHEANDSDNSATVDDDAGGSFDFDPDQETGSAQGDGPRDPAQELTGYDLSGMPSLCGFNPNIVKQRPGLEILLQDNAASLEEQMDAEDEAYEELARTLDTDADLDRHSGLSEAAQGSEAVACTVTENDGMPFSHFKRCLKGDFAPIYFWQEHNNPNGGIRGMVHRSQHRTSSTSLASERAARYLFSTLDNLVRLPRADQDRFIQHMRLRDEISQEPPQIDGIDMPHTREQVDRMCLRSVFSMFMNFPTEDVFEIEGHACISLVDKVKTVLAQGTELSFMQDDDGSINLDGFNGSPRAAALLAQLRQGLEVGEADSTSFGHLTLWSDSFLRNFSRQRENSFWIFVVRISPPEGMSTSSNHTFCLAWGSSKHCHDKVIAHYLEEVKSLMKGNEMYYGAREESPARMVNTCFGLAAYLADTPERNSILHRMNLGNYGLRSGVAGRVDHKRLPSCETCFKLIMEGRTVPNQTRSCCGDWDQFSNSLANMHDKTEGTNYPNKVSTDNPHSFPRGRAPVNETHLVSIKQDFRQMENGVKAALYEYSNKSWSTQAILKYYLSSLGIDTKVQTWVANAAMAMRRSGGVQVSEHLYIPKIWQLGFSIELWLETAMHQLGHGVIASLIELVESIFTEHKLWSEFCRFATKLFGDVMAFRLEWCHLKSLPKSCWLAEDEFGYGRLMLFVYGQYFIQKNINVDTILGATLFQLRQLLSSCNVMVSLLMSKEPLPEDVGEKLARINKLDAHIKVFLSCCHRFCQSYFDPSITEFWMGKSNFISLLNLPEQIAKFGPLGLYWDGSFERFIQGPKSILKSARKSPASLMAKMRIMQAFSFMDKVRTDLGLDTRADSNKRYLGVYVFPSRQDVIDRMSRGRCLSGFILDHFLGTVFIPYSVGRSDFGVVRLNFDRTNVRSNGCGLNYAKFWDSGPKEAKYSKSELDRGSNILNRYCLLLPHSERGGNFDSTYSIICDDYFTLRRDGSVGENELCKELFHASRMQLPA